MVNKDIIRDKIQRIKKNLTHLEMIRKDVDLQKFLNDPFISPAVTRLLHVSIEAMIDVATHIVARKHLGTPKTYGEAFELLHKEGIIPKDRLPTFLKMVKFRNRAVHLYDDISDKEIYDIVQNHLQDFEEFVGYIVSEFF